MSAGLTHPLASTIELGAARSVTDVQLAGWLHPRYAEPLGRTPRGAVAIRGLPFAFGGEDVAPRWLAVDRVVTVDLAGIRATSLVLAQFCDAWRDAAGERPPGIPIGWVEPVGEPLATVSVAFEDSATADVVLRRRFEVNEGIIGWGSGAFLAVPHRSEAAIDPLGPHPRQAPGRYAATGHAGPMTVLPGGWGSRQTGVEDHVPSPTDELMLWLHAIDVADAGSPRALRSITLAPIPGPGAGRLVVVGAITAFAGGASPLRWRPRRSLRVTGGETLPIGVDLGLVARRRPFPVAPREAAIAGWGLDQVLPPDAEEVEIAVADDATLFIGTGAAPVGTLSAGRPLAIDGARVEVLPAVDRRVRVELVDATGRPTAARVRFHARDGRYLPPLGHRDDVNVGLFEDAGADVRLGGATYAYVDGSFEIDLPADGADLVAVHGPDVVPIRRSIGDPDIAAGDLRVAFGDAIRPRSGRWLSGDTHIHFLGPSTALLQARAEGVNVVHLLATQWGDLHTSITDLGADQVDRHGEHAVWVGSENRQNMLGHVGLVGGARPMPPFASGGAPEGRLGGAVVLLMADWLARTRETGGLTIGAHFPLPMAEIAADIASGLLDALELQCFDPTLDSPPIREWYRYLDAGYRLPIVGGTDKMSAEIPVGQIRTWAQLDDDAPLTFETWAAAIRSGRTFVTSGPSLELRIEGRMPGDVLEVAAGAHLEVELVARAAQPMISAIEIVVDGCVAATRTVPEPVTELSLRDTIVASRTGWVAGRSLSPYAIGSAFASSMAAHTSAVYLEVPDRPRPPVDLATPLALVRGSRAWLETLAPVADAAELERFGRFFADAQRQLEERSSTR